MVCSLQLLGSLTQTVPKWADSSIVLLRALLQVTPPPWLLHCSGPSATASVTTPTTSAAQTLTTARAIAVTSSNWCVPKAVLLTAAARRAGIPARLGFADVRNHLTTEKLSERMGTDVFYWHGYSELLLGDRWFKISSAFNMELCDRFGVKVLDFDGTDDALMHPFDQTGRRHMEYVAERGSYNDLPLDEMLADFDIFYPGLATLSGDDEPDAAFAPSL